MTVRHRSPNYPGVPLETAIEDLTKLYGRVKRNEFTPTDAAGAWGYAGTSGPVRMKVAALRQFGLVEGKKGEHPALSRLGLTVVVRNQSSREYKEALSTAALNPSMFFKARETKPDASDSALREWLLMDQNFSDEGANRFVEVFRSTMQLAGFDEDDIMPGLDDDELFPDSEEDSMVYAPASAETSQRAPQTHESLRLSAKHTRVPLRLLGGSLIVAIELPEAMTERSWQQMMDMLAALKPGYVPDPQDAPSLGNNSRPEYAIETNATPICPKIVERHLG